VHASPLLYDIDKDGVREIALATYNGEVLFFRHVCTNAMLMAWDILFWCARAHLSFMFSILGCQDT
jgi:hypothetical protein